MPPSISLVAIDTDPDSWPLTRHAVEKSLAGIKVDDVLFFGQKPLGLGEQFIRIERFPSLGAYSEFVLKCLWPFIATDFALTVHWDGFVVNPEQWSEKFLEFDYVGAPWCPDGDIAGLTQVQSAAGAIAHEYLVGNGGFSLRSRELINLCSNPYLRRHPELPFGTAEDVVICRIYRKQLEQKGLRFAPIELAKQFSYETGVLSERPFGFHGPLNMLIFMPEDELLELAKPLIAKLVGRGEAFADFKFACEHRGYDRLLASLP
ncbi:MAG: hypothetical protein IPH08_06725 [Rhodocyclaceae bacterium]|jgi:hypothetical protein|nr:hypothetical protein [Rhodocyclaceae bacterium]MBK6906775.1 hypothetical protein [Rhodocyclaceae bacterium]